MVAPDAAYAADAMSPITCQLCLDYTNGPSLYVHNSSDQTCTVLRMVWELGCDGLNIGRSELCLEAAELWNHAETCPTFDAGMPSAAHSGEGYVIGHEGIIGIKVQLSFPGDAGVTKVPIDFAACQPDYKETKPPCP